MLVTEMKKQIKEKLNNGILKLMRNGKILAEEKKCRGKGWRLNKFKPDQKEAAMKKKYEMKKV